MNACGVVSHFLPFLAFRESPEVVLQPVVISRDTDEKCLIEPSINSVRISLKIKQSDVLESILVEKFSRFLSLRAEEFIVLRRVPVKGYNLSFLITNFHLEQLNKNELVAFIIHFIKVIDADVSDMKIHVHTRANLVAQQFATKME